MKPGPCLSVSVLCPRWPRGRGEQSLPSCSREKATGMTQREDFVPRIAAEGPPDPAPTINSKGGPGGWQPSSEVRGGTGGPETSSCLSRKHGLLTQQFPPSMQGSHCQEAKWLSPCADCSLSWSCSHILSPNTKTGSFWVTAIPPHHPSRLDWGDSSQLEPLPLGSTEAVA